MTMVLKLLFTTGFFSPGPLRVVTAYSAWSVAEAGNRNVPSGFVTASNAAPLTLSALRTDLRYGMNGVALKFLPEGS